MTAGAAAPALGGPDGIWAHIVNDFSNITEPAALAAFFQVLMIDIVLAGDNAIVVGALAAGLPAAQRKKRSEEHTSELQSLMRISYAVFCLKKKKKPNNHAPRPHEMKIQTEDKSA